MSSLHPVAHAAAFTGEWLLVAFVLLGAVPLLAASYQFAMIGLHRFKNHYPRCEAYFPRVAVIVPAWNEGEVLGASIDRLMGLEYPADRVRVYVVDDASTDQTPAIVCSKEREYPGRVFHLRRAEGGQGKAHTLNHGIETVLESDWMQALLIMDADVIYLPDCLRKMTRHLADPDVGAVTAYIKEGSRPASLVNRFVAYEYIVAQAAARRAQNVLGALACLAGGAQLHSRENLEAIGGRIDTSSLAEDTFTTFETQRRGRRVVFEGNGIVRAEEPGSLAGLWKQRLRWARGNVQVTRRYRHLWFRPSKEHRLGSISFGLFWFCLFLQPLFMIAASAALVVLYLTDYSLAWQAFRMLWIVNALSFAFITSFALLIDPETGRRVWREALLFPGIVSLLVIGYTCFPRLFAWGAHAGASAAGVRPTTALMHGVMLFIYVWLAASMLVAYLAKRLESGRAGRVLSPVLLALGGYGPLLCAVTFASYVCELRRAELVWDKTVKTGKVGV